MAMYAIKDTTLTALGDAVRSKTSETRIEEVPIEVPIKIELNTNTLIFDDSWKKDNIDNYSKYEVYNIDRVSKVKIIYSQTVDVLGGDSIFLYINNSPDTYTQSPYNVIKINQARGEDLELYLQNTQGGKYLWIIYNVNTKSDNTPQWQTAVSAEIYPLDANGEVITTTPIKVKNTMTPLEMVDEINGLNAISNKAFIISGKSGYRFANNGWNWFIDNYGDKITTTSISQITNMFDGSDELTEIPFEINVNNNIPLNFMFNDCRKLLYAPKVNVMNLTSHITYSSLFANCYSLREIPEWVGDLLEQDYNITSTNSGFGPWNSMFSHCRSIRIIPEKVIKSMRNDKMTGIYYGVAYSKPFPGLYCLDELLGIHCDNYNFTSNQFNGFFTYLFRVKNITFATNEDGTPVIRPWKSQTIDLSTNIGYTSSASQITSLGTSITANKRVIDDATYQALKNDPDWFSQDLNYSRYNHDSAVATINSLPDCSATGTNTIKFKGASGALTDGGAINTLTEEEIAVATAKGWTVSLV